MQIEVLDVPPLKEQKLNVYIIDPKLWALNVKAREYYCYAVELIWQFTQSISYSQCITMPYSNFLEFFNKYVRKVRHANTSDFERLAKRI